MEISVFFLLSCFLSRKLFVLQAQKGSTYLPAHVLEEGAQPGLSGCFATAWSCNSEHVVRRDAPKFFEKIPSKRSKPEIARKPSTLRNYRFLLPRFALCKTHGERTRRLNANNNQIDCNWCMSARLLTRRDVLAYRARYASGWRIFFNSIRK